jgi:hypothetical protein
MATGDLYIECEGGGKKLIASSGLLEMLNALAVVTDAGKHGLRTVVTDAAAATINPLVPCGSPLLGWEELLANIIVESASGEPAIGLVTEA